MTEAIVLAVLLSGGCVTVTSSLPASTAVTGEAWYTEATGFFGMTWGSRVWYCPAGTSGGPVTCVEAKMVELTKAQLEAQKPKK
jgi:hypothetical protein